MDDIDFSSHDGTGLSIVMDYEACTHEKCNQTKARDACNDAANVDNSTHVMKLIIRRDNTISNWLGKQLISNSQTGTTTGCPKNTPLCCWNWLKHGTSCI